MCLQKLREVERFFQFHFLENLFKRLLIYFLYNKLQQNLSLNTFALPIYLVVSIYSYEGHL